MRRPSPLSSKAAPPHLHITRHPSPLSLFSRVAPLLRTRRPTPRELTILLNSNQSSITKDSNQSSITKESNQSSIIDIDYSDFFVYPRDVSQGIFADSKSKLKDIQVVKFVKGSKHIHWKKSFYRSSEFCSIFAKQDFTINRSRWIFSKM